MAIYRYSSDSLIDEVRIVKNASGGLRAYLHAKSEASPEQLSNIQNTLLQRGFQAVPYTEDGKPLLEVRGLKAAQAFTRYATEQGWVKGAPDVTKLASDVVTRKERFRNLTLMFTGLVYNIGDIAFMTYAVKGRKKVMKEIEELEKLEAGLVGKYDDTKYNALVKSHNDARIGANSEIMGGVGYALGGIVLSLFGGKDQSRHEVKRAVRKVNGYLAKEGVDVPDDSAAQNIARKEHKGPFKTFTNFVSQYPSETLNAIYTGVGIFLAYGALKRIKSLGIKKEQCVKTIEATKNTLHTMNLSGNFQGAGHAELVTKLTEMVKDEKVTLDKVKKEIISDIKDTGLGAVTMTSALAGLLIKEKKPIEGQPKKHGFARVWEWIQEKPLRATGYGFMVSTAFHAWATSDKYKNGDEFVRNTVKGRAIFVGANVLAEILLAISSKGHGQGVKTDNSVENTVIASAAEVIGRQDPSHHEALVNQVAGYMASPDVLGGKAEDIAKELREQLGAIKSNPWACCTPPASTPSAEAQRGVVSPVMARETGPGTKITAAVHTAPERAAEASLA